MAALPEIVLEQELKHNMEYTSLTVEVDGQRYVGQYMVEDQLRNICTVTAWFGGQRATDQFPQAANEPTYVEALATNLLKQLVQRTKT